MFNINSATKKFIKKEKETQDEIERYIDQQLNLKDSDNESLEEIISKETTELQKKDKNSLRNSPIPSPEFLQDKELEIKINEYLNSGMISYNNIMFITILSWKITRAVLEIKPELTQHEEIVWKKVFIKLLNRGRKIGGKRKTRVPRKYIPKRLTKKDKKKQSRELKKSRKAYKKGKYYTRKKVKSFKSKVSPHILKARKMYKINNISASPQLAKKTGCSVSALRKIVKKGQGAYFSSGSRPNQTGHSWGRARLASSITGGKAAAVDYHVLAKGCKPNSKALRLAKKVRGTGTKRVPKTTIGGGKRKKKNKTTKMKESIIGFKRGPFPKKYTAIVKHKKNNKTRKIHFGDRRYQQYKDRTKLKLYAHKNHNTRKRMQNYFNRHSGTKIRSKAIKKEKKKSKGHYNAKILSHVYLW